MQSYISSEFASELHILFYGLGESILTLSFVVDLYKPFILQYELHYDYYNYASEKYTDTQKKY